MTLIKKTKSKYSKVEQFRITSPMISRVLIVLISLVILAILKINIKLIIFLIVAVMFNAWLQSFQLKKGMPTDFELSTFSTVMITLAFGLKWGIFMAVLSKLFASFYTGSVLADHFFMIGTYINAAILASVFGASNVLLLGLLIVLINSGIMFMISKNILGIDLPSNISYTSTNFIFNSIIFLIFSEPIYLILR